MGGATGDVELPFTGYGVSCNSNDNVLDGLPTEEMKDAIIKKLSAVDLGDSQVTYKLRDWVFSRQRYWGEPIPIYFPVEIPENDLKYDPLKGDRHRICYENPICVPEEELPLRLPPMKDFKPGDDPQGCLARATDWRYFQKDGQWY